VKKYELELREDIKKYRMTFASKAKQEQYVADRVYDYVHQNIQSFVFNLNIPSRWGTQTPFTNITLDWDVPEDMREKRLLLGGEPFAYTFGELQPEMDIINRAFIEVMSRGDAKGRTFTFPIPTYNVTKEFEWENPKNLPLFEMTAKYGTPYFQNFVNSELNPSDAQQVQLHPDVRRADRRGLGGEPGGIRWVHGGGQFVFLVRDPHEFPPVGQVEGGGANRDMEHP
jgi:hypothetical protein